MLTIEERIETQEMLISQCNVEIRKLQSSICDLSKRGVGFHIVARKSHRVVIELSQLAGMKSKLELLKEIKELHSQYNEEIVAIQERGI